MTYVQSFPITSFISTTLLATLSKKRSFVLAIHQAKDWLFRESKEGEKKQGETSKLYIERESTINHTKLLFSDDMSTYTTTTTDITATRRMSTSIHPLPPESPSNPPTRTSLSQSQLIHLTSQTLILVIFILFTFSFLHHISAFYFALFTLPAPAKFTLLFHAFIACGTLLMTVLVGDNLVGHVLERRGVMYEGRGAEVAVVGWVWVNVLVGGGVWIWLLVWRVVEGCKGLGGEGVLAG